MQNMNQMIAAHQRMMEVNRGTWAVWFVGFQARRFQTSFGKIILASDGFRNAIQNFTDALNALGPIDDDDAEIENHD